MTVTVSDNAIIIGVIAIGVFLGVMWMYDVFDIDVSEVIFINEILTFIWFVGLLLIVVGTIYKIVKWRTSSR